MDKFFRWCASMKRLSQQQIAMLEAVRAGRVQFGADRGDGRPTMEWPVFQVDGAPAADHDGFAELVYRGFIDDGMAWLPSSPTGPTGWLASVRLTERGGKKLAKATVVALGSVQ